MIRVGTPDTCSCQPSRLKSFNLIVYYYKTLPCSTKAYLVNNLNVTRVSYDLFLVAPLKAPRKVARPPDRQKILKNGYAN